MPHHVSTLPNQILILLQGFIYIFSGPLKISNFIPVRYKIHYQPGGLFAQFTKEGKGIKMQKKRGNKKREEFLDTVFDREMIIVIVEVIHQSPSHRHLLSTLFLIFVRTNKLPNF